VDAQIRHGEFRLHGLHDVLAQLDREPDRLQFVVKVRQRDRTIAMADGDGAGLLHLFQRAFQALRLGRHAHADHQTGRYDDPDCSLHDAPPALLDAHRAGRMPHWVCAVAASIASPRRSTIVSMAAASMMNGGAIRTWSPRTPSADPPMG